MDERAVIEALRAIEVPDEAAARARTRRLLLAAPVAAPRRPRRRVIGLVALVLIVAAVSTATAAQGPSAVARWVRQEFGIKAIRGPRRRAQGSLSTLPGGGRLLVRSGREVWIVGQGPPRRVPQATGQLGWSAFGHYLIQATGSQLQALDLQGRVLWSQRYHAPVIDPVWSPDGNRIAFISGDRLWVTAGDGTAPRPISPATPQVAPAWRPGAEHVLAVLAAPGRIALVNTDTPTRVGVVTGGPRPVSLSWSADGARLLVADQRSARIYDPRGRLVRSWRPAATEQITSAELSHTGADFVALVSTSPSRSEAILVPTVATSAPRVLLSGGTLSHVLVSPDGRWILVGWRELDSWLFFPTAATDAHVIQRSDISGQLGNGTPVASGWCCQR